MYRTGKIVTARFLSNSSRRYSYRDWNTSTMHGDPNFTTNSPFFSPALAPTRPTRLDSGTRYLQIGCGAYLKITLKDPKRLFDVLEREVVWWRDRRTCMNPTCRRSVLFQEATIHHVAEHTGGGPTKLTNGVLVCKDCSPKRKELQAAEAHFKEYLSHL